jgi:tetratricopeptide (TPR) repeat protein
MKILAAVFLGVLAALPCRAETAHPDARKSAQMEYLRGMLLEHRGDYADALKAYENALAFDADSAYIASEAASLSLEVGKLDEAFQWAQRVVTLEPGKADSHVLLGRAQWAKGEGEAAEASFEEALKLDPKSAESIYSLSSLLATKEPAKARQLLVKFLEQNPGQAAEAHFQIAKLDMQDSRVKAAEEELTASIKAAPDEDSLPARYALAEAYEVEHDTDAALSEYLEIQKFEPQNVALLDHLGQIYFTKGDWEQLRQEFLAAKAAKNDDPTANHWLALYAERKEDYAKAAEYLKSSSALGEDPALNLRYSYYLTQAGHLSEAVGVLETAHTRWPNNDQVAYFLALGYDDLKEDPQAIKLLRKVVDLKPDYREARYQLAVLLEKENRIDEAEKEFRALLAQKSDDASVLNYLGYSLADRGLKLPEAQEMIVKALELDPKNPAYEDSLAWADFKLGRSSQALGELMLALQGLPEDETVWEHVGDIYSVMGDSVTAWRAWRKSEGLYAADAKIPHKAEDIEKNFSPDQLGGLYQSYLDESQGGYKKLSGLCEINGDILGKKFNYTGLFTFKGPDDLNIDLLGPLFTPLLRLRANKEGFAMDPLRIPGLNPEAVEQSAEAAVNLIKDYLSGKFFTLKPALYKKAWRGPEIDADGWRMQLFGSGARLQAILPQSGSGVGLTLDGLHTVQGRQVPKTMTVSGKDFSLSIEFTNIKTDFEPVSSIIPAP